MTSTPNEAGAPRPWSLGPDTPAPEPAEAESRPPLENEAGRAYDEAGNVRPADNRWTDEEGRTEAAVPTSDPAVPEDPALEPTSEAQDGAQAAAGPFPAPEPAEAADDGQSAEGELDGAGVPTDAAPPAPEDPAEAAGALPIDGPTDDTLPLDNEGHVLESTDPDPREGDHQ